MRPWTSRTRLAVRRVLVEQVTADSAVLIFRLRQQHPCSDLGEALGLAGGAVLDLLSSRPARSRSSRRSSSGHFCGSSSSFVLLRLRCACCGSLFPRVLLLRLAQAL